jgi:transcription elongation factor Elf1
MDGQPELVVVAVAIAVSAVAGAALILFTRGGSPTDHLDAQAARLRDQLVRTFLVEPCPRCLEVEMVLLQISPNARSLLYRCDHCGKRLRAAASSPAAADTADRWVTFLADVAEYNGQTRGDPYPAAVRFETPAAPLPYEQTTRTPIPAAVRSEVWRRDFGRCVVCGTRQNLQYDHIIPVAHGGATTPQNLQILCRHCNQAKGTGV